MEPITYSLENLSDGTTFYKVLSDFTTDFLAGRSDSSLNDVRKYADFTHGKSQNTFDEYFLEYLSIGTFLNKYSSNAMSSPVFGMYILTRLYKNRNRIPAIKPFLDRIRGILSTLVLTNKFANIGIDNVSRFRHFLRWLDATGEFSEETIRFQHWHTFLKTLTLPEQRELLKHSMETALEFETQAKMKLGPFTKNVGAFHEKNLPEHRFRENYIFCGRHEAEYHLNMVGAEILNRALKPGYRNTTGKVLLLPTCMSMPKDGKCKARLQGSRLTCTACSPECTINLKRQEFSSRNTEIVLIPHSSEFTRYLKSWENQNTTGLIGVACVLNLLKGGYEMQKLNIPSQCVFLDYCGCRKHWHKDGVATNLNNAQLNVILTEVEG